MRPAAILAAPVLAALLAVHPAAIAPARELPAGDTFSAERFIDSIGINVHLSYRDGPYGRFDTVARRLRELGVRHVRDGVAIGQNDLCVKARALEAAGTRFTYITQTALDADALRAWAWCVGPALEAYEGANEYDIAHPSDQANWAEVLRSAQQRIFRTVRAERTLAGVRVIGPALTSDAAARSVGDLSGAMDQGNMHDYTAGHEPETPGWGAGAYGSTTYNVARARTTCGPRPVVSTETGYGTDGAGQSVDERTQAAYLPRLLLDHFASGIARTFDYELADEGDPPYAHFGLLHGDLTPKPAFTALASLIDRLHAVHTATSPAVRARIAGPAQLRHVTLQRRDGSTEIAYWLAVPSYDLAAHRAIDASSARATLETDAASAVLYRYDAEWRLRPQPLSQRGRIDLPADDRVAIVELTAARG